MDEDGAMEDRNDEQACLERPATLPVCMAASREFCDCGVFTTRAISSEPWSVHSPHLQAYSLDNGCVALL